MAVKSLYCQKQFLKSTESAFKITELVIGFSSLGLIYFGNVMSNSGEPPDASRESQIVSWVLIPCWVITCTSFIALSILSSSKCSLRIDAVLNAAFAVALGFVTVLCSSTRHFIWLCVTTDTQDVVIAKYCDFPNEEVLRNEAQNLALMILISILCTVHITHCTFVVTKLCTKKFLPKVHDDVDFSPLSVRS